MKTRVVLYSDGRTSYCRIQVFRPHDPANKRFHTPSWCAWPEDHYRQYDTIEAASAVAAKLAAGCDESGSWIAAEFGEE